MVEAALKLELDWTSRVRYSSVQSHLFKDEDFRLDAVTYTQEAAEAMRVLTSYQQGTEPLGNLTGQIYHPTESQPRSNFKRIWADSKEGVPFLTGRQLVFFRPSSDKYVSRRMPKLHELMIPEGTVLLSRSGTTGHPTLVGKWLARFAVTDDALRIFAGSAPVGFTYAFLSCSFAQALIAKSEYGKVVSHIEAKHIASIPVPKLPGETKKSVHEKIIRAFALRDEANEALTKADDLLHSLLALSPFDESDVEYLGAKDAPRAFAISSADIGGRLDSANHVPLARSALHKLGRGKYPLKQLGKICCNVVIPARFKRNYVALDHGVPYLLPSQLPTFGFDGLKRLAEQQAKSSPEYLLVAGQLLVTTDGTVGVVHPVTERMEGWFGSNNIARLWGGADVGFLYAFLSTPFGLHQIRKDIYGGVVDHLNEDHIKQVMVPDIPPAEQKRIGDLVRNAFAKKDQAIEIEDVAIAELEYAIGNEREEDNAEAAIARKRLSELKAAPESLVQGRELRARLARITP
jgi:type I restriction enzyme S subunit